MADTKSRRKNRVSFTADEARDNMKEVLNLAEFAGERPVITRHGKPAAAVISIEDLAKLERAS